MTPGRTSGTGTDGERPLEHSVMKRSTEKFTHTVCISNEPSEDMSHLF